MRLELADCEGLRERVGQAVERERACCPFLDISIGQTAGRLVLTVDGPPEAAGTIDGFEELATGGSGH